MKIRSLINFGDLLPIAVGLNVHFLEDGGLDMSLVVVKQEKNEIRSTQVVTGVTTTEDLGVRLKELVPAGARIHINLAGKGVLIKSLPTGVSHSSMADLMKASFPMLRVDDFVAQRYEAGEQRILLVARKDALARIVQACDGYAPVSFSLGVYIVSPLLAFLDVPVVDLDLYRVRYAAGAITGVEAYINTGSSEAIKIGEEHIHAAAFLAYACACSILIGIADLEVSEEEGLQNKLNGYEQRANIYKAARLGLGVMLVLLMVNAIIFFSLQSATQQLEEKGALVSGASKQSIDKAKLNRSLAAVYDRIGWRSDNLPLYYADRIATAVNDSITLTVLEVGVESTASNRQDRQQFYAADRIAVKGEAEDPVALKRMVDKLEKQPWIQKIGDRRYRHDARMGKGIFDFTIYLK